MSETSSPRAGNPPAALPTVSESTTVVNPTARTAPSLRLWPAVAIVALQWASVTVPAWIAPGTVFQMYAMMWGSMLLPVVFLGWWLFASRLPWKERWLGLICFVGLGALAAAVNDPTFGLMAIMFFAVLKILTAWTVWLAATPFLRWPVRRLGLFVVFLIGWGSCMLIRLDGVTGAFEASYNLRWRPTAEDRFLVESRAKSRGVTTDESPSEEVLELQPGDWPGFRGPERDGRCPGVRLAVNWNEQPPHELWRHRVGPGWSSFAVVGNRAYTQEQRGEEEVVVCYNATSGGELWSHADRVRFTETVAGPGPRATPTFHDGKIYALGAKGNLNCLDAGRGTVLWSRDIVKDSGAEIPTWGFSASPMVAAGIVTVFCGASQGKSVLGYDATSGELVWSAGDGKLSYCSTQLSRLGGVEQLVISTEDGLTAFEPASGTVLWRYEWPFASGARVTQPAIVGDSDVLIGTGFGVGIQRVRVSRTGDVWKSQEVWANPSRAIKPYYNDLVVHRGHLYGFDSNLFACVNLEEGQGKWKTRGYGNGEVLLLPDQDLLLILSEAGEVALVEANPAGHTELCKFQAIEGKTWNHPVIANGRLFVRNGEEAVCYELKVEGEKEVARRGLHD